MTLDDLLSQPLVSVSDDGFSARVALALLRRRQRRHTLLLSLTALGLAPLMALLPLAEVGERLFQLVDTATFQPHFLFILGVLIAAWGLWPRPYRF